MGENQLDEREPADLSSTWFSFLSAHPRFDNAAPKSASGIVKVHLDTFLPRSKCSRIHDVGS
jgi:hypothetical protein